MASAASFALVWSEAAGDAESLRTLSEVTDEGLDALALDLSAPAPLMSVIMCFSFCNENNSEGWHSLHNIHLFAASDSSRSDEHPFSEYRKDEEYLELPDFFGRE